MKQRSQNTHTTYQDTTMQTLASILTLPEGSHAALKDLSLLLEIDLRLGRRKQFYDRLQQALDFLLEQAEDTSPAVQTKRDAS